MHVHIEVAGIREDLGNERPRRRRAPGRRSIRAGRVQRDHDGACRARRAAVDVCRDRGRQVLDRELVARLRLTEAQANRCRSVPHRVARRRLLLAEQRDREGRAAGRVQQGLRAAALRHREDVRGVPFEISCERRGTEPHLNVRILGRRGAVAQRFLGRVRSRDGRRQRRSGQCQDGEQQTESLHGPPTRD